MCAPCLHAGWSLRRVLTDNGKEFKGVFAAGCERLRVRVTKDEASPRLDEWLCGALAGTPATVFKGAVAA